MSRKNDYIIIKLVEGGILYLTKDGKWESELSMQSWRNTKAIADVEVQKFPGAQVDRINADSLYGEHIMCTLKAMRAMVDSESQKYVRDELDRYINDPALVAVNMVLMASLCSVFPVLFGEFVGSIETCPMKNMTQVHAIANKYGIEY